MLEYADSSLGDVHFDRTDDDPRFTRFGPRSIWAGDQPGRQEKMELEYKKDMEALGFTDGTLFRLVPTNVGIRTAEEFRNTQGVQLPNYVIERKLPGEQFWDTVWRKLEPNQVNPMPRTWAPMSLLLPEEGTLEALGQEVDGMMMPGSDYHGMVSQSVPPGQATATLGQDSSGLVLGEAGR